MSSHEFVYCVYVSHVIIVDILNNSSSWGLLEKTFSLHISMSAVYCYSHLMLKITVLGCAAGPDEGPFANTTLHD